MDSSTLAFHRVLIRSLKGALKAYECWIDRQSDDALEESLKALRTERAKPVVDTTGKEA